MHSKHTASGRIMVLGDRDAAKLDPDELPGLCNAVADAHVLVVAPAGPVARERWIVDLTARRAQAKKRLGGWATVLAGHASELEVEVGDEDPASRCLTPAAPSGPTP